MVKDAEVNAADDKRKREEIDTKNRLDTLAYQVEKESKEWADKVPAELKSRLDAAVERARKAHKGDDMNDIKGALDELNAAFQAAGQAVYAQGAQPAGDAPPAEGSAEAKKEEVADADYEIVDEAKK
jgi:molecular chaperone DnaK